MGTNLTADGVTENPHSLVVITGMHRSGTSMLAEVLTGLGFKSSPSEHFMRGNPHNPRGFFEDWRVNRMNDQLLIDRGAAWDTPWEWTNAVPSPEESSQVGAIVRELVSEGVGVVKDPRFCLTYPIWRDSLARLNPRVILIVRSPREVASSLEARDGIARDLGEALWVAYMAWALKHLGDEDPVIHLHREVLDAPRQVIRRLQSELGIGWLAPECADPTTAVDSSLVHYRTDKPPQLAVARQLWELFLTSSHLPDAEVLDTYLLAAKDVASCIPRARLPIAAERDTIAAERDTIAAERDTIAAERDTIAAERDTIAAERDTILSSNIWRLSRPYRLVRGLRLRLRGNAPCFVDEAARKR
jgi:hypothetical protein